MVTNLNPKKRKTSGRISWGTGELAWTITDKNGDPSPGTNHNETVQNRLKFLLVGAMFGVGLLP